MQLVARQALVLALATEPVALKQRAPISAKCILVLHTRGSASERLTLTSGRKWLIVGNAEVETTDKVQPYSLLSRYCRYCYGKTTLRFYLVCSDHIGSMHHYSWWNLNSRRMHVSTGNRESQAISATNETSDPAASISFTFAVTFKHRSALS